MAAEPAAAETPAMMANVVFDIMITFRYDQYGSMGKYQGQRMSYVTWTIQ